MGRFEMNKTFYDMSPRRAALIAGYGLLFMVVFVTVALPFVFGKLIVPGQAATTANNILANLQLFRIGISSLIMVIILDVLVAWAFYLLLKPQNNSLSLLTAWFRLVYSIIFAVALGNYFNVLQLLSGADYLAVLEPARMHAQVMLSVNAFEDIWAIGFIFFGLHLSFLGYLVFKADYIPKWIGLLVIIAGLSYLIDYLSKFLFPENALNISTVLGYGELIFMFWLLFRGAKIPEPGKDN